MSDTPPPPRLSSSLEEIGPPPTFGGNPPMLVLLNSMNRAVVLDMAIRDVEESIVRNESAEVSEADIDSLLVYGPQADNECAVCLEGNLELRRLACGHYFCRPCITSWFRIRNACPLCRSNGVSTTATVPTDAVKTGFRLLRQLVFAMMCEDTRNMLMTQPSTESRNLF
jgi:hypothetical protein